MALDKMPEMKLDPGEFYYHLQYHSLYVNFAAMLVSTGEIGADESLQMAAINRDNMAPFYYASLDYLDHLHEDITDDDMREAARDGYLMVQAANGQKQPEGAALERTVDGLMRAVADWKEDLALHHAGLVQLPDDGNEEPYDGEPMGGGGFGSRAGPRAMPRELFPVHSSAPVYDIGETIARGQFVMPEGQRFPQADIIGKTRGRIELLPFWDHKNNRPLSPQNVNLVAGADLAEFARMQEEALKIATSYNEEMATFFYAMDAYWLSNAKSPDEFIELQIADLMRFTGKKPVKTHGKYTGTFRRDQLQRAGMMVYGMGFSMVEIERTVVKGVGERTHYKRLWDVSDIFVMHTLDEEKYIESITYRPNEFFRSVSFGARRETALLMAKVLGLDFDKMVVARRLGRYYTWLWRDRAHGGAVDAPINCGTLLARAGVEVEKGKERYARRSLELALDRLEGEGIIAQWVLLEENGAPADLSARIPFAKWTEMKIAVTPPDVIMNHYTAGFPLPPELSAAGPAGLDLAAVKAAREKRGLTLGDLSAEAGVELSTLSRIMAGKTKRPRGEHVKALKEWLAAQVAQPAQPAGADGTKS